MTEQDLIVNKEEGGEPARGGGGETDAGDKTTKCQETRAEAEEAEGLKCWQAAAAAWASVRKLTKDKDERAHAKEREKVCLEASIKEADAEKGGKCKASGGDGVNDEATTAKPAKKAKGAAKSAKEKKVAKTKTKAAGSAKPAKPAKTKAAKPEKAAKPAREPRVKKVKEPKPFMHDERIHVGDVFEKDYNNRHYKAKAVADGFVRLDEESPKSEGQKFRSLSALAEYITKKATSGYIFFGLEKSQTKPVKPEQLAKDYAEVAEKWNQICTKPETIPAALESARSSKKLEEVAYATKQMSITMKRAARVVRLKGA